MTDKIKVHPLRVKEVDYEVTVDSSGIFHTTVSGDDLCAASRDALLKKIQAAAKIRAVRVDIPFVSLENNKIRVGSITGKHGATGHLLVAWEDGTKTQLPEYQLNQLIEPLDQAEMIQFQQLVACRIAASKALEQFVNGHRFINAREVARKKIAEAMTAAETETEVKKR